MSEDKPLLHPSQGTINPGEGSASSYSGGLYGDPAEQDPLWAGSEGGEEEADSARPPRTASVAGSTFNLANAVLGAGVLAFPSAYDDTGMIAGVATTIVLVALAAIGLAVLGYGQVRSNVYTLQEMANRLLGRKFGVAVEILLLLYFAGACVAYLDIIGDTAAPSIEHWGGSHVWTSRKFVIGAFTLFLVLPLAMVKRIQLLSFSSTIAVIAVIYTVFFVIIESALWRKDHPSPHIITGFNANTQFFYSFPIICFAFQCHVAVVPILGELVNPTPRRVVTVMGSTLAICVTLYVFCGIFGYMRFGSVVNGDVLKSYDVSLITAAFARLAMGLTATFSYPMSSYNARLTIQSLFFGNRPFTNVEHIAITLGWVGATLTVAMFVPGITVVFDFVGSTGAVAFMFVYPSFFIWRFWSTQSRWAKPASIGFLVLALFVGCASLGVTIAGLVDPDKKPH